MKGKARKAFIIRNTNEHCAHDEKVGVKIYSPSGGLQLLWKVS